MDCCIITLAKSLDKGFPVRLKSPQPPLKKGEFIRDWFLASLSIRQLKHTAMLLNAGLSYRKIRHFPKGSLRGGVSRRDPYGAIFGVSHWDPYGAIFYPALKGRNHIARGRVSAANASERHPGSWTAQTRHRPGTNKGDDSYSDDATYDQRQRPQRYHDLSLPAAPDFRSLSEFLKKPLHIQIPGF